jgi:PAS domain S-box-containing protein
VPETEIILPEHAEPDVLAATGLVAGEGAEEFERMVRVAARLLRAPIALFSLVDGERLCLVSGSGLPAALAGRDEIPLHQSPCQQVIAGGKPVLSGDACADPRLRDYALVREHGVRAYAGYPVARDDGTVLGSFCVCDREARDWDGHDLDALGELARIAALEVDRRRHEVQRVRAESRLREAEGWLRPLVEQSIMAIYCYQDGRFIYANPRCMEVFGYPRELLEAPGALARIIHPDDLTRVTENIRARLAGEIPTIRYTLRGVRSDGEIVHLDVHGSRTVLNGRPALIGVGYDITDRLRAEREREGAMQSRDRFFAMASHELRTPVSTVMLYNDLLLGGMYEPLSEQQREAVERSQGSARHLLDLINDLLDLSRLEAGRMALRQEPLEVVELLETVVDELTPVAAQHGSTLEMVIDARPLPLVGDARRIRQIALNLLSNAMKFGGGHPIRVHLAGDGAGGALVEVADQGPGIAPEDLPRIWEDFVQLGDPDSSGTGLGLPMARRLAALMGAELQVTSEPGSGSTFRLHLHPAPGDATA